MADFALGLICGAAIIAIIWWRTYRPQGCCGRDKETSNVTTVSEGVVVRPDNGRQGASPIEIPGADGGPVEEEITWGVRDTGVP